MRRALFNYTRKNFSSAVNYFKQSDKKDIILAIHKIKINFRILNFIY